MTPDWLHDNLGYVEELYSLYEQDPDSVEPSWRRYFSQWSQSGTYQLGTRLAKPALFGEKAQSGATNWSDLELQESVDQYIRAFRVRGHRIAKLDPLGRAKPSFSELELSHYDLSEAHLEREFSSNTLGLGRAKLSDIRQMLHDTYCGSIGVQYMHIDDPEPKFWLQEKMESTRNHRSLTREQQLRILRRLTDAQIFEEFIGTKYVGAKRFGLDGGESLIPLLDMALDMAGDFGVTDVVIGMAHRGRLNVMVNIMGKNPALMFREFDDTDPERYIGRGDVKYHLGCHNLWKTSTGKEIDLTLCFNPSHLEFVSPVAIGRIRSRQDRLEKDFHQHMALVIHGDAAFAGQGVVAETFNMSEIPGFRTGGTVHIVLNNQIGFTTLPGQSRSSHYATDVAKMLQIPILHVNGEEPEAVAQAVWLAMEYRNRFHKDVVIDMYCYRKYGHNEGDEPAFTQPVMYKMIRARKSVRENYLESLVRTGEISHQEAQEIALERKNYLDEKLKEAREPDFNYRSYDPRTEGKWVDYVGGLDKNTPEVDTSVERSKLVALLTHLSQLPQDFKVHPKIDRLAIKPRAKMAQGELPLNWGAAETLAYATLLSENHAVRLTGQDVGRGTFSHRHAILYGQEDGKNYIQLQHLPGEEQARFQVWNSPLTETAVLAFEYGFSLEQPESLTIWEAQFGDFFNVAQVIMDQFIATGEDKWTSLTGLVMLLPHGFEGQGPEHSSARLERFLQMGAEDNIVVVNLTTPAQLFHCLRRQVVRKLRKPLVVMSPKSLLRHPKCISTLEDLSEGHFQKIIADTEVEPEKTRRVLLCSGKVYYDLLAYREKHEIQDVAIVRIEQLYPLCWDTLKESLSIYNDGVEVVWTQEEPVNMGACPSFRLRFGGLLAQRLRFRWIARAESSSPATGSHASHAIEHENILKAAFAAPSQESV